MAPTKTVEAQVVLSLGDRLSAGLSRIQARFNRLTSGLGITRLTSNLGQLGQRLGNLGPAIASVGTRLTALTGLFGVGVGGAAAAAYQLTKSVADIGGELEDTSYRLGIGVEALQEYRYAAKLSGIEAATFDAGVQKLGLNISAATNGNKAMAETFKDLGVTLKDSNGNLRSTESILNDTFAALAKVEDPARRNELAFKAFGRSGVGLVQMLMDGEEGLIAFREEARRTGHVMDAEAAAFGAQFGDNVDRLTTRLEGLRLFLGVQLLPIFNEVVVGLTDWVTANQALIRSTISEWVEKLAGFMRDLMNPTSELRVGFADFAEKVSAVYDAISPLVDAIGGPGIAALAGLAFWIGAPLIGPTIALTAAVINLGIALMATPIGWVIGGLVLLGVGIYALITHWDAVVAAWNTAWNAITTAFSDMWNAMDAKWQEAVAWGQGIKQTVIDWFTVDLYGVGVAIVESLKAGITAAWDQVTSFFSAKIDELLAMIPEWVRGPLGITVTGPAAPAAPTVPAAPAGPTTPWSDLPVPTTPVVTGSAPVQTDAVQADTVSADKIVIPEPIAIRDPQQVDARLMVGTINVTVPPGMNDAQATAIVQRALAQQSAQHAANVTSALND